MPQVAGKVKERGEKNGAVYFVIDKHTPDEEGKTAKVWVDSRYSGEVPEAGGDGIATFHLIPKGEFQMKSLDSWVGTLSGPTNGNGNGSSSDKDFIGRYPGVADFFLATRWSFSLAADLLLKRGETPTVSEVGHLAEQLFRAAWHDALGHKQRVEKGESGAEQG